MVRALVTGCAGFVGSGIVRRLLATGVDRVVGVDRISDYYSPAVKRARVESVVDRRYEFVEADLNAMDLSSVLGEIDVVFHQAGQPGVRPSWGDSFDVYVDDNIRATQRLLEAVVAGGNRAKIVYASSSSVYGDAQSYPVDERSPTAPRSPYGVTKLAAEHLVSLYAANHGVDAVSLRYFTVYGPGQRPDMAFSRMCSAILADEPIDVYGSGEQIRDFTYVDDVITANLRAWQSPTSPGAVVNIAGGSSVSLNECINTLARISGRSVRRTTHATALGDVFRTGGATDRARSLLDWVPQTSIEVGLALQYEAASSADGKI